MKALESSRVKPEINYNTQLNFTLRSTRATQNQPGTFKLTNHSSKFNARTFLTSFLARSGCFLPEKHRLRTKLLHFDGEGRRGKLQMFLGRTAAVPAGQ